MRDVKVAEVPINAPVSVPPERGRTKSLVTRVRLVSVINVEDGARILVDVVKVLTERVPLMLTAPVEDIVIRGTPAVDKWSAVFA